MYYDDEDDDPYTPRIGPAAMPSPRSEYAPYYSGRNNMFEDFLEEFEGLAYDCALTDPQRVDAIIRYFDPSIRELCRSFNGFRSRNWPLLRQSLINIFGSITPRPQVMRQRLLNYVQDSSRARMNCADDVPRYYRQFLCLGEPLVHSGHLSKEERDVAFLCGFHPEDREVLRPRLLGKRPLQPLGIPFHFEDVLGCARAAFAYDGVSLQVPSWSSEYQFEPSNARREQPVARHGSRDTYGLREVTRAIASNPETTTTPDELPLSSHSTPYTSSSSLSVSESQYTQAPSVTLDQPEPAHTFSTTLLPSASPPSHNPSLVHSATDNDLIPAPTSPIITSTLLPSASPTPFHTHSLAPSAAADVPEISSILPLSSIMPVSTTPSISSGFQCLPSATEDQSEPEPAPTLLPSIPTMTITPSHVHSATDENPEILSTFPSPSTTPAPFSMPTSDFEHLPSATVDQPEYAPTLSSTLPSPPSISSTFLSPPARLATEDHPEPEFASTPSSPALLSAPSLAPELSDDVPELSSPLPTSQFASLASSTPLPPGLSPTTLSETLIAKLQVDSLLCSLSTPPDCSLASHPSPLSVEVSPLLEISTPVPLQRFELDSTPSPAVDIVPLSQPEPSWSSPCESVLLAPLEPIQCPPTLPQRPPGLQTVGSDSSALEVAPALALSTPQLEWQEPSPVCEAPSTLVPCLPHPTTSLLPSSLTHCDFALVTIAVLVSTLLDILATLLTHTRKFWSKYEDIGNNRIGTLKTSKSRNIPAHRLRLGQYMPRAPRLVFDPGGQSSSSSVQVSRLLSAHEDVRKPNDLIVFDPG
ncbi:hypothetical protein EDB84DRAFT_139588, partial [Lactarius hengduanensis]